MFIWEKGVKNEQINNDKQAILDFTRAIELDPLNKFAYNSRALTKSKMGDLKGAIED